MRQPHILALSLGLIILVATPALAQNESRPSLGTYNCISPAVPCTGRGLSPSEWAEKGDACLRRGFGLTSPKGIIDTLAGIDSSNCLKTTVENLPEKKNKTGNLIPKCCIIKTQDGTCGITCTQYYQ